MAFTPRNGNQSPHAAYQAGLAAYETGLFLDAIELLTPVAEQGNLPGTLGRFYLGQAHMQQGIAELRAKQFNAATQHFAIARRINPDSGDLARYLADCHVALRRFDLAVVEVERDQAVQRSDDTLPIRLAHALARDGQLHRAVESLGQAIEAQPNRADLHFHLGVLHASVDDYGAARAALLTAARIDPGNADIGRHLALAHAALGDMRSAADCLRTAQRLAPYDANIAWLLALAIQAIHEQGQDIDVEQDIDVSAFRRLDVSLDDAALTTLGDVILREPDFVEAFLSLPASEVDGDLFAVLAATLEKALERHPDYADLHYHCARAYERLGHTDAAIGMANRAVRINPQYVQALIALGRLYSRTKRADEATERLQQAIDFGGDYPDVHFMLGELLREDGFPEEAAGEYRRALELNSNYTVARKALEAVVAA